ncbi:unnamed protein product [Caenorhabditis auriculariae]|uniref:Uncharacterized protein n=1 Tax=Caenorhabditis auriculariae TaxID=2777116 RepID=A0A8S1HEF7_9PELO|nr:unnamed protein product [Caenorhabditis auriculariae]
MKCWRTARRPTSTNVSLDIGAACGKLLAPRVNTSLLFHSIILAVQLASCGGHFAKKETESYRRRIESENASVGGYAKRIFC